MGVGAFVFEGDVAAVAGVAENFDDAVVVGRLALARFGVSYLRFYLAYDGVRGAPGYAFVRLAVKVAGVQIDPKPWVIHRLIYLQHVVGGFGEVAVILDAQKEKKGEEDQSYK